MNMKKQLSIFCLQLLPCLLGTARAQGTLSAVLEGTRISGTYTSGEALAQVRVAVCSQSVNTRWALPDAGSLTMLTPDAPVMFAVDLATVGGAVQVTDLATQTEETFAALTDEQRGQFVAGALSVRVYGGAAATPETLLAECPVTEAAQAMTVSSAGIAGGVMDDVYGKKGTQKHKGIPTRSIPLTVRNLPAGTAVLAMSMVDPDGGDWVHWLAANLPVTEEVPANASVEWAAQMVQGVNDFGQTGYGGPTPPRGTHTYVITVYALAKPLDVADGFTMKTFRQALAGNVLAEAVLTGDYRR
jgi:hypothetical protein